MVKQGNVMKALGLLDEYRRYEESQNVTSSVFSEPWGQTHRVHLHHDFPNAGEAQEWIDAFRDNPRAVQALHELHAIVESTADAAMLVENS
jgi:hypothetical protein